MSKETIKVNIKSRSKVFFDGNATSVTSLNDKGKFDVLPQHANFITLIKDYVIVVKEDGEEEKFDIKTGVLKNINNDVAIYLETGRKK